MGRQPRGPDTVRQVTLLAIPAKGTVFKDGQCFQRTGFTRLPVLPEAGIPVQRRCQLEIIQCRAVDRVRRQCFRCSLQCRQAPMTEYIAPVRRKYLVRLALLGGNVPGFEQQAAIAALRVDALLAQRALDGRVAGWVAGSYLRFQYTASAPACSISNCRAGRLSPLRSTSEEPRARRSASSAASERWRQASEAAPGTHSPSSCGAWM